MVAFYKQHFPCDQKAICSPACCTQREACTCIKGATSTINYLSPTAGKKKKKNFLRHYSSKVGLQCSIIFILTMTLERKQKTLFDSGGIYQRKFNWLKKWIYSLTQWVILFKPDFALLFTKGDDILKYDDRSLKTQSNPSIEASNMKSDILYSPTSVSKVAC